MKHISEAGFFVCDWMIRVMMYDCAGHCWLSVNAKFMFVVSLVYCEVKVI